MDVRPLLNTTKCRFVLVEDVKVDVGPEGQDPLRVRRRTVAAQDAHVPCYLIAKDILKVRQMLLCKACRAFQYQVPQSLLHHDTGIVTGFSLI